MEHYIDIAYDDLLAALNVYAKAMRKLGLYHGEKRIDQVIDSYVSTSWNKVSHVTITLHLKDES